MQPLLLRRGLAQAHVEGPAVFDAPAVQQTTKPSAPECISSGWSRGGHAGCKAGGALGRRECAGTAATHRGRGCTARTERSCAAIEALTRSCLGRASWLAAERSSGPAFAGRSGWRGRCPSFPAPSQRRSGREHNRPAAPAALVPPTTARIAATPPSQAGGAR